MSCEDVQQRIAVIVPQNCIWLWHHKIISVLQENFKVDVYASAKAPRYPLIIRLWIRFENYLFDEIGLAKFSTMSATSWSEVDGSVYSHIFNLSEASITSLSTCVIEPRYGGHTNSLSLIATLLARENPYIAFHLAGEQKPVTASYLAIEDRIVLSRGLKLSFARLVILAKRTAVHLTKSTSAAMLPVPCNALSTYAKRHVALFVMRWSRLSEQIFRFDKWSPCRG